VAEKLRSEAKLAELHKENIAMKNTKALREQKVKDTAELEKQVSEAKHANLQLQA
jgi:hypothetical protein